MQSGFPQLYTFDHRSSLSSLLTVWYPSVLQNQWWSQWFVRRFQAVHITLHLKTASVALLVSRRSLSVLEGNAFLCRAACAMLKQFRLANAACAVYVGGSHRRKHTGRTVSHFLVFCGASFSSPLESHKLVLDLKPLLLFCFQLSPGLLLLFFHCQCVNLFDAQLDEFAPGAMAQLSASVRNAKRTFLMLR